jgi:hypothetical protein
MVHHGEGEIRAADFAAFGVKPSEGLRRSALVNEVAVNIDDRGLGGLLVDDVGVPDFLIERFRSHGVSIRILALLWWEANGGAPRIAEKRLTVPTESGSSIDRPGKARIFDRRLKGKSRN